MFKLNTSETRSLVAQPETGMGYQLVEATRWDGKKEQGIAYNAELVFLGTETQNALRMQKYSAVLRAAQSSSEIRSIRVLTKSEADRSPLNLRAASNTSKKAASTKDRPAKDAPVE